MLPLKEKKLLNFDVSTVSYSLRTLRLLVQILLGAQLDLENQPHSKVFSGLLFPNGRKCSI